MTIQSWEHERRPIPGTRALHLGGNDSGWVSQPVSLTTARSDLHNGDVLRTLNAADVLRVMRLQNKRVRVEGEMLKPGDHVMPSRRTTKALIAMASGVNRRAFPFRFDVARVSVRTSPTGRIQVRVAGHGA